MSHNEIFKIKLLAGSDILVANRYWLLLALFRGVYLVYNKMLCANHFLMSKYGLNNNWEYDLDTSKHTFCLLNDHLKNYFEKYYKYLNYQYLNDQYLHTFSALWKRRK